MKMSLMVHTRVEQGFTLIELLIVLTILAIIISIASPSFRDTIERYRVRSAAENLSASFYLARSEAMRQGGGVSLIPGSSGWNDGWSVATSTGTVQVIDAQKGVTVTAGLPAGKTQIDLNRWGVTGLGALNFQVKPDSGKAANYIMLCISSGGRLKKKEGVIKC